LLVKTKAEIINITYSEQIQADQPARAMRPARKFHTTNPQINGGTRFAPRGTEPQ
jgi:hypothetical protein